MSVCNLCPHSCNTDREIMTGRCGMPNDVYIAKSMIHMYEEPCLLQTGHDGSTRGAGAIFFSGCNLGCVFCQNYKISHCKSGTKISENELENIIYNLCHHGASCIEFITPTHYSDHILRVLKKVKSDLSVPVVWNSGGYERAEVLKDFNGLIDIYMPDLKYFSPELSKKYSGASDYFVHAVSAIKEMIHQVGKPLYNPDNSLKSGVIIRHLVLPGCRNDSIEILGQAAEIFGTENIILSLMSQYTPDFYTENHKTREYKNLERRLTTYEYQSVQNEALKLGFNGYFQKLDSAHKKFTPDF